MSFAVFDDVFVLLHMAAKLFTLEKRAVFEEHCKAVACAVPPRAIICDICVVCCGMTRRCCVV